MIEDNGLIGGGSGKNNNLGQNLSKSKKTKNLAKSRRLKNHPKLFRSKKTISEILVNLTVITNVGAIGYLTTEARVAFTCLSQAFTKALIFQYLDLECHI